jgi:hypothetical protein
MGVDPNLAKSIILAENMQRAGRFQSFCATMLLLRAVLMVFPK